MKLKKHLSLNDSPFYNENELKFKEKYEPIRDAGNGTYLSKKVVYKSDEYTKVIIPSRINIDVYINLPDLSKSILHYILVALLEYNSPTFIMRVADLQFVLKLKTTKTIYKAINSLIDANYIARSPTKEVYWINHNYYYKGNIIKITKIK